MRFTMIILMCALLVTRIESFTPSLSKVISIFSAQRPLVLSRYHENESYVFRPVSVLLQMSSSSSDEKVKSTNDDNEDMMDDDELLRTVTESQLQDLCKQTNISAEGTKAEMLTRLREFSQKQAEKDKELRLKQKERIEMGMDDYQGNGKAKHKISTADVLDDDNDDSLDGVFYYSLPGQVPDSQNKTLAKVTTKTINPQNAPREAITAPLPPPDLKPNADGERVVTVYSSTDQNDLTGIAAQQAATSSNEAAMAGGYSRTDNAGASADNPQNTLAAGPFGDQSGSQRKKATEKEFDEACAVVSELVYSLLSLTGAPGFQEEFSEGITPFMTDEEKEEYESSGKKAKSKMGSGVSGTGNAGNPAEFVGFDPSRVPTQLITQSSRALRVGNGDALRKVLDDAELQAIGFDGMNGDDKENGGGHYLEVQKVGTFLEGFRKAEVRRIARETTSMLLDQLVANGVQALDSMLMGMTKGSDDSSDSGELNDALVKYLDDAVREQETKIEQMYGNQGVLARDQRDMAVVQDDEKMSNLWNVTTEEDGTVVESLDPNDPEVKQALEQEQLRQSQSAAQQRADNTPKDAPRQLLMLLTLLRERVKAEAVFSNDEKGKNLRMLAYCLHANDDREREKIIVDSIGKSLDVS